MINKIIISIEDIQFVFDFIFLSIYILRWRADVFYCMYLHEININYDMIKYDREKGC